MQTYQTLSYALYGLRCCALGGLVWMLIEDPQEQAQRSTNPPRFQLNPTRRGLNRTQSWSF